VRARPLSSQTRGNWRFESRPGDMMSRIHSSATLAQAACGDRLQDVRYAGVELPGGFLAELTDALNRVEVEHDFQAARDLYLGSVACELGGASAVESFANAYRRSRLRRDLKPQDVLCHPAVPRLVKSIFDFYFSRDLYGYWLDSSPLIMSSGSFRGDGFSLPSSLKRCISFAIERNWYGYSDSCGRRQTREALAAMVSATTPGGSEVDWRSIAVVLGGTAAISSIADYLAWSLPERSRALCALPNYPPLVAAVDKRYDVEFAEMRLTDGEIDLSPVIAAVQRGYAFVMLQTVVNPWGKRIDEGQLVRLLDAAPSNCMIVLDECHDCFGTTHAQSYSSNIFRSNVIRVNSLSKRWAVPGMKVGWIVADREFVKGFYDHASTTYGGPPSLFYLLLEMFARFEAAKISGRASMRDQLNLFSADYEFTPDSLDIAYRDYLLSSAAFEEALYSRRIESIDALGAAGFRCISPDYSNNVAVIGGSGSSYLTYSKLIGRIGVSVYPGILCMQGGPGHFRVSPCIPTSDLSEGLRRICSASEAQ
jgi:aspartate/methionine/tyrosine aminotransferase